MVRRIKKRILTLALALALALAPIAAKVAASPGIHQAGAVELKAGQSDTFTGETGGPLADASLEDPFEIGSPLNQKPTSMNGV